MTTTTTPVAGRDPIDTLIPPPLPWWARLIVATVIIAAVGLAGYVWHFGLVRPSPDCCGSGSASAQIGLSNHPEAVTVTAYFFNSSEQAVAIVGATADLPGASVVDVAPFAGPGAYEMPPRNLATFPHVVDGHSNVWLAISFVPEHCDDDGTDWGSLSLDLEVADDHWYPTFGRSYENPDAIVPSGPSELGILAPAALDGAFEGVDGPLAVACIFLGR